MNKHMQYHFCHKLIMNTHVIINKVEHNVKWLLYSTSNNQNSVYISSILLIGGLLYIIPESWYNIYNVNKTKTINLFINLNILSIVIFGSYSLYRLYKS